MKKNICIKLFHYRYLRVNGDSSSSAIQNNRLQNCLGNISAFYSNVCADSEQPHRTSAGGAK